MSDAFFHGLLFTPSAGGGGGGITGNFVASDTQIQSGASNPTTTTHTLDGGGSDRVVIAAINCGAPSSRTFSGVTLDGVSGTILGEGMFSDSGESAGNAFAYWPDSDHPGSGDFDVVWSYSGNMEDVVVTIIELQDMVNPVSIDTAAFDAGSNTSHSSLALDLSESGKTDQVGAIIINSVTGRNNAAISGSPTLACSNTDRELVDQILGNTAAGLWMDDDVASDPISYDVSGSGSDTIEAWRGRGIIIQPN